MKGNEPPGHGPFFLIWQEILDRDFPHRVLVWGGVNSPILSPPWQRGSVECRTVSHTRGIQGTI